MDLSSIFCHGFPVIQLSFLCWLHQENTEKVLNDKVFQHWVHFSFPLGERTLPAVRTEELIYVLQELARLILHPETASALPIRQYLKEDTSSDNSLGRRTHLLVMFPSFCELVASRFVFSPIYHFFLPFSLSIYSMVENSSEDRWKSGLVKLLLCEVDITEE